MKFLVLLFTLTAFIWAKPTYRIAIVTDGQTENGKFFEKAMKDEITSLLQRDFKVVFPRKLRFDGKWSYGKIASSINKALKSNQCDLVITIGSLSSHYIGRKQRFAKPVIATAVINPKMQKIPYKNGISNKYNLTYITPESAIEEDIVVIKEFTSPKKIVILVNSIMQKNTPRVGKYLKNIFKKQGISSTVLPVTNDLSKLMDKIPDDTDLVYVTPLFQRDKKFKEDMYDRLRLKEIASFSVEGHEDVELGALIANAPKTDYKRYIRKIALHAQQIAIGFSASKQLVEFKRTPSLYINMKTAREIDFVPNWEPLSRATIIEAEVSDSHYFSIEDIMNRAVAHNLQVVSAVHEVEVTEANKDKASSVYLPQVHVGFDAVLIDEDRADASLGVLPPTRLDAYLGFSQQVYNQRALANISVNEHFLDAQNYANDFIKLDIAFQSSALYLQILLLRTRLEIQKSNLALSRSNLRSALSKREVGLGSPSDIYRWESKIANDKKNLLYADTKLQQVKYTLNSILDLPQDLPLNFKAIDERNPIFLSSHPEMHEYFSDQKKFLLFEKFLVEVSKENMPSINQSASIKRARELIVDSNYAALYMPTVSLEGGIRGHIAQQGDTEDLEFFFENNDRVYEPSNRTDWEFGLFVKLPLYTGGAQTAEYQASRAALLSADAQKRDLENNVERSTRSSLLQAKASYLAIDLSAQASISANKNLQVVKDIYGQGKIGIIALLDAQNNSLRTALLENNARYGFMKDLLRLQHDIGQVNFNLKDDDWALWIEKLHAFEPVDSYDDEDEEENRHKDDPLPEENSSDYLFDYFDKKGNE